MNFKLKIIIINLVAFGFFILDRILKYIFSTYSGEYFVFGDWLKLKYATNTGIAFGIPINFVILSVFYFLIFLILMCWLIKSYQAKILHNVFVLSLIIVGAFSNLLDRIYLGHVVDYIDLKFYTIFNLADAMIVIGVIIFMLFILVEKNKSSG